MVRYFLIGLTFITALSGNIFAKINTDALLKDAKVLGFSTKDLGTDHKKNPSILSPKKYFVEEDGTQAKYMTILDDFTALTKGGNSSKDLEDEDADLLKILTSELILMIDGLEIKAYKPGNPIGYDSLEKRKKLNHKVEAILASYSMLIGCNEEEDDAVFQKRISGWANSIFNPKKADSYAEQEGCSEEKKQNIKKHLSGLYDLVRITYAGVTQDMFLTTVYMYRLATKKPWYSEKKVFEGLGKNSFLKKMQQMANPVLLQELDKELGDEIVLVFKQLITLEDEDFYKDLDTRLESMGSDDEAESVDEDFELDDVNSLQERFAIIVLHNEEVKNFLYRKGMEIEEKKKVLEKILELATEHKSIGNLNLLFQAGLLTKNEARDAAKWIEWLDFLASISMNPMTDQEQSFDDIIALAIDKKNASSLCLRWMSTNQKMELVVKKLKEHRAKENSQKSQENQKQTMQKWGGILENWDENEKNKVLSHLYKSAYFRENLKIKRVLKVIQGMKVQGSNVIGFDDMCLKLNLIEKGYNFLRTNNTERVINVLTKINDSKKPGVSFKDLLDKGFAYKVKAPNLFEESGSAIDRALKNFKESYQDLFKESQPDLFKE